MRFQPLPVAIFTSHLLFTESILVGVIPRQQRTPQAFLARYLCCLGEQKCIDSEVLEDRA